MQSEGIALRHIGTASRYVGDFMPGNQGDAIPLAAAADVIEHERQGMRALGSSFLNKQALHETVDRNIDDFNGRLRRKMLSIVQAAMAFHSHAENGEQSHFILLRNKDNAGFASDYDPDGTYPLGKAGRSGLEANQMLAIIRLTADDYQDIKAGKTSPAERVTDKILQTIPAVRHLTESMESPAVDGSKTLTTLSTQAQFFIDGNIPPEAMQEEKERFKKNLDVLIRHDPQAAANFCCSIAAHPSLASLKDLSLKAYPDALNALEKKSPETARMVARTHKEVYGDLMSHKTDKAPVSPKTAPPRQQTRQSVKVSLS